MSRFIKLSQSRKRKDRGAIIQHRYDEALNRLGKDHPLVKELRERVISVGLDPRDQTRLDFDTSDEPWGNEQNPISAARDRLEYIRSVNKRLMGELSKLITSDERSEISSLLNVILRSTNAQEISSAFSSVESILASVSSRTDPPPFEPRFKSASDDARMPAFRGVGPKGLTEPRMSPDGVYGPGYYMYNHPLDARSYASPGGGILVGTIPKETDVREDGVIVLDDIGDLDIIGHVPTENTLREDEIMELIRQMGVDPGERYRKLKP